MTSVHPAFDVEVITPEGASFHGSVASLRLQGKDGNFGILARHAPLIAALDVGTAKLELADGKHEELACGEGFVEVRKQGVRVLVDFCERKDEIDVVRARESQRRAKERLKARESKIDHARAEAALRRALIRLQVAGAPEV